MINLTCTNDSSSSRTSSNALRATKKSTTVTFSNRWIHFFLWLFCPATSITLQQSIPYINPRLMQEKKPLKLPSQNFVPFSTCNYCKNVYFNSKYISKNCTCKLNFDKLYMYIFLLFNGGILKKLHFLSASQVRYL